jgi:hypothetical protein
MGNRRNSALSVINEPVTALSGVVCSTGGNVSSFGVSYAFSQLHFQRGRVSYRIAFLHNKWRRVVNWWGRIFR